MVLPSTRNVEDATVMTNGTLMSKSKPKAESTASPVEVTPRKPTQTLFLTLSSLVCKISQKNYSIIEMITYNLFVILNKNVVCGTNLTHDRTENRMAIK